MSMSNDGVHTDWFDMSKVMPGQSGCYEVRLPASSAIHRWHFIQNWPFDGWWGPGVNSEWIELSMPGLRWRGLLQPYNATDFAIAKNSDELWTSKDGRRTRVGDMDEEHVRNALRMILRADRVIKGKALRSAALINSAREQCGFPANDWEPGS